MTAWSHVNRYDFAAAGVLVNIRIHLICLQPLQISDFRSLSNDRQLTVHKACVIIVRLVFFQKWLAIAIAIATDTDAVRIESDADSEMILFLS